MHRSKDVFSSQESSQNESNDDDKIEKEKLAILEESNLVRIGEIKLSKRKARKLSRRALSVAGVHENPAQAEAFIANLAANTKNPEHIDLAHDVIDEIHSKSHESVANESHDILDTTIDITNESISAERASILAIEVAHRKRFGHDSDESIYRMLEKDAIEHQQQYNREAEIDSNVLSKDEVYSNIENSINAVEKSPDDIGREIALEEMLDDAGIVGASIFEREEIEPLLRKVVEEDDDVEDVFEQAGDKKRSPDTSDVIYLDKVADKLKTYGEDDDEYKFDTLTKLANMINNKLPLDEQIPIDERTIFKYQEKDIDIEKTAV